MRSVTGAGRTYGYDAENRLTASTEPNITGTIQ
jgi:hypothetical protein